MTVPVECPTCRSIHRVSVEQDERGGYAYIQTVPCGECGENLCSECSRFSCDCGGTFCTAHGVAFEGAMWCRSCINKMLASDAECIATPDPADAETATRLSILAESGCTLEEVRASMKSHNKEVS